MADFRPIVMMSIKKRLPLYVMFFFNSIVMEFGIERNKLVLTSIMLSIDLVQHYR